MWVPIDSAEDTYDMSRHQKAVLINRGAQNQKHYMYVLKITKKVNRKSFNNVNIPLKVQRTF